jgi:hypothetical protein
VGAQQQRYAVRRSAGGLAADGGGLASSFSRSGVVVRVHGRALALGLVAVGAGGFLRSVAPSDPTAARNVASYDLGSVQEWYRNGPLGLEQGFTVRRPLAAARSWLSLPVR